MWPSAHAFDASDADLQLLGERGLYDQDQVDRWKESGEYLGHRIGIDHDGRWLFFVAGD